MKRERFPGTGVSTSSLRNSSPAPRRPGSTQIEIESIEKMDNKVKYFRYFQLFTIQGKEGGGLFSRGYLTLLKVLKNQKSVKHVMNFASVIQAPREMPRQRRREHPMPCAKPFENVKPASANNARNFARLRLWTRPHPGIPKFRYQT